MDYRHPAHVAVRSMEQDVEDVGRWADVIRDLGTGSDQVSQNGLFVIGGVLKELASRLESKWSAAFAATGGTP